MELGQDPRYPIESVDNALQLLSLFVSEETIRVKDAAEVLGVSTGTAHRLLAMLVYRGFVTQDPLSKVYAAGPMLLSVGLRSASRLDMTALARPHLKRLHDEFDETTHLALLHGTEVLFADGIESTKVLRVVSRAGQIHPAHCTSVGKAILAELPRDHVLELYPDEELPQITDRSIDSRTQLLLELDSTAARRYAINFGELEDGIGSVAVAIHDPAGAPVAALGVGAPLSRLRAGRLEQLATAAQSTAEQIGAHLPTHQPPAKSASGAASIPAPSSGAAQLTDGEDSKIQGANTEAV